LIQQAKALRGEETRSSDLFLLWVTWEKDESQGTRTKGRLREASSKSCLKILKEIDLKGKTMVGTIFGYR
jgi:hypothetical protein